MPTMRQLQREIGQCLDDRGYSIYRLEDDAFVLRHGSQPADNAPAEIEAQFQRWRDLEYKRMANQRAATLAELDAIDARLAVHGYAKLDEDAREAFAVGGPQADALLDELQARVGIFTDDISAAMSGEEAQLAFDAQAHSRYSFPPGFTPSPLNVASPLGEVDESAQEGMKP